MNKIFLIIQREYLTRVRKKSFLIMTILGPLLVGGLFTSGFLLDKVDTEVKTIAVIDESHNFIDKFKDSERIKFIYPDVTLDSAKKLVISKGLFGVLYIPLSKGNSLDVYEKPTIFSESQPGLDLMSKVKFTMEKEINTLKYINSGIDEKKLAGIRTEVTVLTKDLENRLTNSSAATGTGFAGSFLIYIFIFIYGAMVMRGVLEEKTNRIVEVIISSVKPFQLMMGKILGVALVGLTQFLLWVTLSTGVIFVVSHVLVKEKSTQEKIEQDYRAKVNGDETPTVETVHDTQRMNKYTAVLELVNYPVMIVVFIFYFLGGYLLYSALFAAVGSAVDADTDTQQFMFPITIPLILAYIASISVLNNPQGNVAFWFSMIPFTSPVVMMARIPFGVPWGQIVLSMVLLIAGFVLTTWIAARIYRTGILMYGKKVSYRELWKWLRHA
jgi:ABC-2 type transport system permease protein